MRAPRARPRVSIDFTPWFDMQDTEVTRENTEEAKQHEEAASRQQPSQKIVLSLSTASYTLGSEAPNERWGVRLSFLSFVLRLAS